MQTQKISRTCLFDWHVSAGAKMVAFAGWEMPILYSSIVQEHNAVRQAAGIFDVSHMGQFLVQGSGALDFLQMLCTNDISRCKVGYGMYSHLCNEQGGVIDDIFVYCLAQGNYLVVVNAATTGKDFAWFSVYQVPGVEVKDISSQFGMIALQGPKSQEILAQVFKTFPQNRNQILESEFAAEQIFLCRTGYTGEDGFEVLAAPGLIVELWKKFVDLGAMPCGLGARDTLRLEAGFLLYGSDMDEMRTSVESGPLWVLKFDKKHFIGRQLLKEQLEMGLDQKLTAFKLTQRGIPRHGSKIFLDGQQVGLVTSGTFSPSLQCGIAMGYVAPGVQGNYSIECLGKPVPAEVVTLPFYKKK